VESAEKTVEKFNLAFPVAHSVDAALFAEATGAFYEPEKGYIHATAHLIRPDNRVALACYSTGSVGRITAPEAIRLIDYFNKNS